jgi:hypothetical protein
MSIKDGKNLFIFTTTSSSNRIPSVVCYNRKDIKKVHVGEEAKNFYLSHPKDNFLVSQAKRFIGLNVWDHTIRSIQETLNYDIVSDDFGRAMIRLRKYDEIGGFVDLYPQQGNFLKLKFKNKKI